MDNVDSDCETRGLYADILNLAASKREGIRKQLRELVIRAVRQGLRSLLATNGAMWTDPKTTSVVYLSPSSGRLYIELATEGVCVLQYWRSYLGQLLKQELRGAGVPPDACDMDSVTAGGTRAVFGVALFTSSTEEEE